MPTELRAVNIVPGKRSNSALTLIYFKQTLTNKNQKVGKWFRRLHSEHPHQSQHPATFNSYNSCEKGDIIISICYLTSGWLCDQKAMFFNRNTLT